MNDETHTSSAPEDPGIGPALKKARLQRGVSLEEVEQATKIRIRYLEALEREEYDALPAAVYVQGFLKTYANYLGLDGEAISQEFKRSRGPQGAGQVAYSAPEKSGFDEPLINPGEVSGTRRRGVSTGTILTTVAALLVLFLVVGGLYFIGRGSQSVSDNEAAAKREPAKGSGESGEKPSGGDDGPSGQVAGTTGETTLDARTTPASPPETTLETMPESTTEPDTTETLRVEIRVEDRPSWLEIRVDGETSFVRIAEPGFSETFEARRKLKVTTGDAGAVRVSVNGQDIGVLGDSGEVLTRKWTLKTEG